jgi:outer membrane protein assembly factor BamB
MLAAPAGSVLWMFQGDDEYASIGAPSIGSDGTIYVTAADTGGSQGAHLYAISPTGQKLWSFEPPAQISSAAALADDDIIYFITSYPSAQLYSISKSGNLNWSWEVFSKQLSPPAIAEDGTTYVGALFYPSQASSNALYALRPDGSLKWRYKMALDIPTRPTIGGDGTIYFGGNDRFYAFNPDGSVYWSQPWKFAQTVIREDQTLLVAYRLSNGLGYLSAVELDGVPNWTTQQDSSPNFLLSPEPAIFLGPTSLYPNGLNRPNGLIEGPAAFTTDNVYHAIISQTVLAAYTQPAGLLWQRTFEFPSESSPVITPEGIMYIGTRGGRLYAIQATCGLANTSWPMRDGNPQRNGRAYKPHTVPPVLNPLRLASGRGFQMIVRGEPGHTYEIQSTSNLLDWTPWTNILHTNFITHVTDSSATNVTARHYRAMLSE